MRQDKSDSKQQSRRKKVHLFKPRKKTSAIEDSAIQYLQLQYDKILPDGIKTFKDFPLSQKTLKGLKDNNFMTPTEIQKQAIGYALQGKDILGAAKTGSGKTLAFIIPILENLFCKKWTRLDGVGALVISPTRELAFQIYETLRKVGYLHDFSAGLIIGGQNLKFERKRMDQVNILICTPGRLLQHMDENPLFHCNNLQILVLDEADRCLDMGFETTMNAIIENIPTERQTLLFSATQTKSVKDLARLSLSFPTYVAPHEQADTVTPESLQQSYIVCEINEKIGILWSFIRNHLKQKVLVFMATCKQVKYTYDLFCKLRPGVSLLSLYGTLHQEKREKIYNEFCRKSNVVLFATDLASRGLDFPKVNWVIQMDCPEDVETYIHRAGRTARGVFGKGEGLLMLLPHEEMIVEDLRKNKVPINKISVDPCKVIAPQKKIEMLLLDNTELKQTAQRAFVNYLKSVFLMKNKEIFNVQFINTDAYARSLGLVMPPQIKFLHKYQKNNAIKNQESGTEDNNVINMLKAKAEDNEESGQSAVEEDDEYKPEENENQKSKMEGLKLHFHNEEDSNENYLFEVKEFDIQLRTDPTEEVEIALKKKPKTLTKVAFAKKILKNQIKVNTQIKFTEDDETIDDKKKDIKSDLVEQCDNEHFGGIDVEKVKEFLKEEDNHDKRRFTDNVKAKHKEKKRKIKNKKKEEEGEKDDFGSQSESDELDISWLPDPDKIYGKKDDSDVSSSIEDDDKIEPEYNQLSDEESKAEKNHRPTKRKLAEVNRNPQESMTPGKVKKIKNISNSLSVHEAEAFAMQLLRAKQ